MSRRRRRSDVLTVIRRITSQRIVTKRALKCQARTRKRSRSHEKRRSEREFF